MVQILLSKCDKCGSTEGVEQFGVSVGTALPYDADLCATCAAPLQEVIALGRMRVVTGETKTSHPWEPQIRMKVHEPDELDRLEEEYRARQAKAKK